MTQIGEKENNIGKLIATQMFKFMQFQCTPQHLVIVLKIIVGSDYDMTTRQLASIYFKNFVAKNWPSGTPGMNGK